MQIKKEFGTFKQWLDNNQLLSRLKGLNYLKRRLNL